MKKKTQQGLFLCGMIITVLVYTLLRYKLLHPLTLKSQKIVFRVSSDETLTTVTERLEQEGIITSARILRLYLSWERFDTKLSQGEFHFYSPLSTRDVAWQLIQKPNKPLFVVTIPEGSSDEEVILYYTNKNKKLQKEILLREITSKNLSGYLFPDTYYLSGKETENVIVQKMLSNFKEKYLEYYSDGKERPTLEELLHDEKVHKHLILASILEGEAKTEYDMKVIAGILLKREKLGMKLQVDVSKETYQNKGFPKNPLNNPGLMSLRAAKNPIPTEYLFYITGNDGKMYYAKNFKEHRKNILNHLQ